MTSQASTAGVRQLDEVESDAARASLFSRGYAVMPAALGPDLLDAMTVEIDRIETEFLSGLRNDCNANPLGEFAGVRDLDVASDMFFDLSRSAPMCSLVECLLPGRCLPLLTELFCKPAQLSTPTPPHQDQPFYDEHFTHELAVTLWCPLSDVGLADGPLQYAVPNAAPGQQLPHETVSAFGRTLVDANRFEYRTVLAERGDVIVHHAYAIHRSAPNVSGRSRRSIGFTYRTSSIRTWPSPSD